MTIKKILSAAILIILAFTVRAQKADTIRNTKSVNLDELTFHAGKLLKKATKARTTEISIHFTPEHPDRFDSGFFFTKFAAVSNEPIKLNSLQGRLADFDTSFFDLFLAVLQFNGGDTLFKTIPIKFDGQKREKDGFTLDLYGRGIVLEAAPFYLGYGFRVKTISKKYLYPLYVSLGGDGVYMLTRNGSISYTTRQGWPNIFPFVITYIEH